MGARFDSFLMVLATLFLSSSAIAAEVQSVDDATRARCLNILREGLDAEAFWPSMHAAEALTLSGHFQEVIPVLLPRLEDEKDSQHRCGLARELVRAGHEPALNVLWEVLVSEDPHGHGHACESLLKINRRGDGKLLRHHWKNGDGVIRQLLAAAALARGGDEAALHSIRKQLVSHDDNVARIAAWLLSFVGDAADLPVLRSRLESVGAENHQIFFHAALATLGEEQARDELKQALSSADPQVRVYAAEFCGTARIKSALPLLTERLADDDLDIRIRAAQAILLLSPPTR